MKLLLPKTYYDPQKLPVFFLGGPIRGAGDWQREAILKLSHAVPEALIICPSRYSPEHPLYKFQLEGPKDHFESQTFWERHYLKIASTQGCVLFWIPKQDPQNPRPISEGPYGQDSYGELGEWRGHLMHHKEKLEQGQNSILNFAIGAEEDSISGLNVIKKNYRYALGDSFIFHNTLDSVIQDAVEQAKKVKL